MAGHLHVHLLASITCSHNDTLIDVIDGDDALLYDKLDKEFVHINLKNNERTILATEGCKTFPERFSDAQFVPATYQNFKKTNCTAFFGAFQLKAKSDGSDTGSLCFVSFLANYKTKNIAVTSTAEPPLEGISYSNWKSFYQSSDGKVLCIFKDFTPLAIQIFLNEAGTLDFNLQINQSNKVFPDPQKSKSSKSLYGLKKVQKQIDYIFGIPRLSGGSLVPFIEENVACYFSYNAESDEVNKLFMRKVGTNETSYKFVDAENEEYPSPSELRSKNPIYFDGYVFYVDALNVPASLWSFDLKALCFSRQYMSTHHKSAHLPTVRISPDGLATIAIYEDGRIGDESAFKIGILHIYECDLSIQTYTVTDKNLGEGGYGRVVEGIVNKRQTVAVKILVRLSHMSGNTEEKFLAEAVAEAKNLKMLDHINIVKGFGYRIESNRFLLFMEKMTESVRQKILRTSAKKLDENETLHILQHALEGLFYLHTLQPKPVVHRDIKCANILIDEIGIAKLGDFGLVAEVSLNTAGTTDSAYAPKDTVGTYHWRAPEVLDHGVKYGRKADVWSIGCSLVEMLTGYPPHSNIDQTQLAIGIIRGTLTHKPQELVPNASKSVVQILDKCFKKPTKQHNIDQEYELEEVRPHSWELLADVININELLPFQEKYREESKVRERKFREESEKREKEYNIRQHGIISNIQRCIGYKTTSDDD